MNIGGFFKAFQIMNMVSDWSNKALADGKVTLNEVTELATSLAEVLDIPLELKVPKGKTKEE